MTVYTYTSLNEAIIKTKVGTCISVNDNRIIIPTDCAETVSFTNPDDLDVNLLKEWKKGKKGTEFENQKLMPADCLVMYDSGNLQEINNFLSLHPNWQKTPCGIKKIIEALYLIAPVGAKNTEPAIWNFNFNYIKNSAMITPKGDIITDDFLLKNRGKALKITKQEYEHSFILLHPGDKLISPDGREQTAGAMSAIAVRQADNHWNLVQLNAKGYKIADDK